MLLHLLAVLSRHPRATFGAPLLVGVVLLGFGCWPERRTP